MSRAKPLHGAGFLCRATRAVTALGWRFESVGNLPMTKMVPHREPRPTRLAARTGKLDVADASDRRVQPSLHLTSCEVVRRTPHFAVSAASPRPENQPQHRQVEAVDR